MTAALAAFSSLALAAVTAMTATTIRLIAPPPSSRRVDCHIVADPVAFLMVAYARQSQWEAIAKGKLLAWGRRPWAALRLTSYVRNP